MDDSRSTNLNVGLTNFGSSTFDSPFSNAVPLLSSQLEIHLKWASSVAYGQTAPTTGGSLVAPAGATQAGRTLCITEGAIGFVDGGSEDGVFKFKVSGGGRTFKAPWPTASIGRVWGLDEAAPAARLE